MLQGDAEGVKLAVETAKKTMDSMDATVTKVVSSMNQKLGTVNASMGFISKSAKDVETVLSSLDKAFGKADLHKFNKEGEKSSPLVSARVSPPSATGVQDAANRKAAADAKALAEQRTLSEKEATAALLVEQNRRTGIFDAGLREAKAKMRSSLAIERAIQQEGSNSITAIRARQAEQERQIQNRLASELTAIRQRFAAGEINWITQAAQRNASLSSAEAATLRANAATLTRINVIQREAEALAAITRAEDARAARSAAFTSQMGSGRQSTSSLTMIGGMSAAGRQAAEVPPTIPVIPPEVIASHRSLFLRVAELIGIYRVLSFGINTAISAIKAIPRIGIELDSTRASLEATVGSGAKAGSALAALDAEAERTGINIGILRENFRGFQASTSLAGESLESTWKMFTNLNTVITGLHLSSDKANGIFLAMAQIFNKGKVQSEELVKQLGNLLPGAFASFAAASGRSTMQLATDMKKGLVYAHNEVESFTAFMADRFAISFAMASQGLNANIGRMQTSFIHLGEAIYEGTSGPMVTATKALTSFGNYLTAAVNGQNKFGEAVSLLVGGGLSLLAISLAKTAAGFLATTSAAIASEAALAGVSSQAIMLQRSLLFLSAPTALLTGLGAIAFHINGLKNEAASVIETIDNITKARRASEKEKSKDEQMTFDIENDPDVKKAKAILAQVKESQAVMANVNKATPFGMGVFTDNAELTDTLDRKKKQAEIELAFAKQAARQGLEVKEAAVNVAALSEREKDASDARQARLKHATSLAAMKERAKSMYDEQNKANKDRQLQLIADGQDRPPTKWLPAQKATEEQKKQAELARKTLSDIEAGWRAEELHTVEAYNKQLATAGAKGASTALREHKSAVQAGYKDIVASISAARGELAGKLTEVDGEYGRHEISLSAYYSKKKSLQAEDLRLQRQALDEELRVAFQEKDIVKIAELNKQKAATNSQELKERASLTNQMADAQKKYSEALKESQEEYLSFQGKEKQSMVGAFDKAHKDKLEMFKQEAAAGDTIAQQEVEHISTMRSGVAVQGELNTLLQEEKIIRQQLADLELQINTDVKLGAKTELQGIIEIDKARRQAYTELTAVVEKEKKLMGVPGANPQTDQTIKNSQAQLKAFSGELGIFGQRFKTIFTDNFAQGFSAFISGTSSAKEAFNSFAQGIIRNLADIAAQEMAKQILGLVSDTASSVVGAYGASAANSSTFSDTFSSSNSSSFWTTSYPSEKGNVVQFSSGGIPDLGSSMQSFRTASGQKGTLRENGPEAILPLARDSYGKLGVKTSGGGSSGGVNIGSINITLQEKENATPTDQAKAIGDSIKQQLKTLITSEIANSTRSGATLNQTTMAANF